MKHILIRAGKMPFDVVDYPTCLDKNILGTNSGNLLFAQAAQKHLATEGTTLVANGYSANPDKADEINEKYDVFVVPLANAFRKSFESHLNKFTALINKLKIPVVVLGVGAQTDLNYSMDKMKPLDKAVSAFTKAVLDHSASIGVRGVFTQEYLQRLGFKDVEIIGCPSMFMWGKNLRVEKKKERLDADSKISINISPYVEQMGDVGMYHHEKYKNLIYIPQNNDSLQQLLWGESLQKSLEFNKIPKRTSHPMFQENKVRFFIDPITWINYLKDFDFVFGTRIHGNTAGFLAGVPSYVLAHDSRTLELAEYFDMPYKRTDELGPTTDAAQLYQEADYTKLHSGHDARFATYLKFLEKNGLDHIYATGEEVSDFDTRIQERPFPPALEGLTERESQILGERLGWLADKHKKDTNALKKRLTAIETSMTKQGKRLDAMKKRSRKKGLLRLLGKK